MKNHSFSITYHGTIDVHPRDDDNLETLQQLVEDSFKPDLMSGVKVNGKHINIDMASND